MINRTKQLAALLVIALAVAAHGGSRSTANYNIPADSNEPGGVLATTAMYTNEGGIGSISGVSAVSTPAETLRAGFVAQLTPQAYTVSPGAGANGGISPSTPQTVDTGGNASFTAIPNTGYVVNQWLVNGSVAQTGGASFTLTNVTANANVQVIFTVQSYTVTPSAGANGGISPNSQEVVASGSSIGFTATPNSGYVVNQWLVNGNAAQTGGTTFTLSDVTGNATVQVTFTPQTYTVTPSAGANGSISPTTSQIVDSGGSITFSATPMNGYVVDEWLVNGTVAQPGGTGFTLTNVTGNASVQVTFTPATVTYSVTPSAGANGGISPSTAQTVNSGASAGFTAIPVSGYEVNQWLVNGILAQSGGATFTLADITENTGVEVTFTAQTYTVTPSAGANGSVSPNTAQAVISGSSITFAAMPNPGYVVSQWLVNGGAVQTGGTTCTLSNVTANATIEVTFVSATATYTVTPLAGSDGSISPNTAQTVNAGANITFEATPNIGYTIAQWLVNGGVVQTGGTSCTLVAVNANATIEATFAAQTYTVTPIAGANGAINPSTAQTVNSGANIGFTATPASGYLVNQWLLDGNAVQTGGTDYTLSDVTADASVEATFKLNFLPGLTQVFPGAPPPAQGSLLVNLTPQGVTGEGWRFVGEQEWRMPGVALGGLPTGEFEIEFRPAPGYLQPLRQTVLITSGSTQAEVGAEYYPTAVPTNGGVNVTLEPTSLTTGTNPAEWRFLGDDDTMWRASGTTAGGLSAGVYLIEFKPVPGETTPATQAVAVPDGETVVNTIGVYILTGAQSGTAPEPVDYSSVVTGTGLPYAYVGQIRSDNGEATGFVVASRVVATAGHVVFDDGTLSYTTGLQWLFQRESGTYEPVPQYPAGSYVLDGYAGERAEEKTPGVSDPQSQDLDAAAMYFLADAGRGGSSGYVASDTAPNEYLLSSSLMTLVGYPVDGIPSSNQGQIFATPIANIAFSQELAGEIDGTTGAAYQVYTTTDITASGGASGGPLCVQAQGGKYYPAAIYLGGYGDTVVRAIDSNVVTLFNSAEISGSGGDNHSSGGVLDVSATGSQATLAGGGIEMTLTPANATWSLGDGSYKATGDTVSNLAPGTYEVTFAPVAGYQTPANLDVPVVSGETNVVPVSYAKLPPPSITSSLVATGTEGAPISAYRITATNNPAGFSVSGGLPPGVTMIDTTQGIIAGTPLASGTFAATIQAINYSGTDTKTLVFYIAPEITSAEVESTSVGQPFNYQIKTGTNDEIQSYEIAGLPGWLMANAATGFVSGTAQAQDAGLYTFTVSAINAGGTNSMRVTVLVNASGISGVEGQNFPPYQVAAAGAGISFDETGLPPGLSLDNQSGLITGTASEAGTFPVNLTVNTPQGPIDSTVDLTINPVLGITIETGSGTVTNVVTGQQLNLPTRLIGVSGTEYRLLARGAPGSFFDGWTGDVSSSDDPLEIVLSNNLNIGAVFSIFASAEGSYSGLVESAPVRISQAGSVQLTLDGKGNYSGRMRYGLVTYSMRGAFDNTGSAGPVLKAGGPTVRLHLEIADGFAEITGSAVTGGTSVSTILAKQSGYSKMHPFGEPGSYTALIEPTSSDAATPQGIGYGAVNVSAAGKVSFVGALNDGTKVSVVSTISADESWPFYAAPYKTGGYIAGWINFASLPGTGGFSGTLDWGKTRVSSPAGKMYPGGFQTQVSLMGSRYVKPGRGGSVLAFSGSSTLTFGLTPAVQEMVRIASDKLVPPIPDKIKLTINAGTGIFSGSFLDSSDVTRKFSGAVLQSGSYGGGLFLSGTVAGGVELKP
jgi:hypothetical protein